MGNMKTAVLYYSVSGQTGCVANAMKFVMDCDVFEIQTEKVIKPDLFSRYYFGIKQMKSKELPKLKKSEFNADEYDCIIIGTPTWASSYAPAIAAFAEENKIENKKMCLFTTYAGGGDKQCIDAMKKLFPNNDFIAFASFKNPKKADKQKLREKLEGFAARVKGE